MNRRGFLKVLFGVVGVAAGLKIVFQKAWGPTCCPVLSAQQVQMSPEEWYPPLYGVEEPFDEGWDANTQTWADQIVNDPA